MMAAQTHIRVCQAAGVSAAFVTGAKEFGGEAEIQRRRLNRYVQ